MIGKKEVNLITNGKKLMSKHKKNFKRFTEGDFFVRIGLVDETSSRRKILEYKVNSNNWMDHVLAAKEFGDEWQVYRIEFSKTGN